MTTVPTDRHHGEPDHGMWGAPPNDEQAERWALSAMMLGTQGITEVAEILTADDFYRPVHATIFTAATTLWAAGEPVDPVTISAHLHKTGNLQRVGGAAYIHDLYEAAPSASAGQYYAEIVREKASLRRLADLCRNGMNAALRGEDDADRLWSAVHADILSGADQRTATDYVHVSELIPETLDQIEAATARTGELAGVPTGFIDLDALTNGFKPGQMIVVAGRPGMGKTTLALDFVRAAAVRNGVPSAFFSLEMSRIEVTTKLIAAHAGVSLHHMSGGTMTDDDWTKIARRETDIRDAPLYIDDSHNLDMMQIRTKAREIHSRHGLGLIVVDYLQLMQVGGTGRTESRQQEVSTMSRNLKILAKELEIPVIVLSQLNRGPEQRQDKKPAVSDLRESGSIEQDADMVILLHREDAYEPNSARAGEVDVIVGKHRGGPTATITVASQLYMSRFVDMAHT